MRRVVCTLAVALVSLGCGGQLGTESHDAAPDAPTDHDDHDADAGADADGALEDVWTLPDGNVPCGPAGHCDPTTQYCVLIGLTLPGNGECFQIPAACLDDRTCACLAEAGAPMCNCTPQDSGILLSNCTEP